MQDQIVSSMREKMQHQILIYDTASTKLHCQCVLSRCCMHIPEEDNYLVDTLSGLGIGISYDRVLRISAEMGNGVCENFLQENVVCPPKLRGDVFTSAAIDKITTQGPPQHMTPSMEQDL